MHCPGALAVHTMTGAARWQSADAHVLMPIHTWPLQHTITEITAAHRHSVFWAAARQFRLSASPHSFMISSITPT
eukprot:1161513-Pelagomonas_calceolata.AAC.1